jgi:hypothetical protein
MNNKQNTNSRQRPALTEQDISLRNWGRIDLVKQTIELAKNLQEDPDKRKRLVAKECIVCYYKSRGMHTNSCVSTNCKSCNKKMQFGNSDIDEICIDCAAKHKLCKHCGADFEYKERKKARLFNNYT